MKTISRREIVKNSSLILTAGTFLGLTACFNKDKPGEASKSNTTTTEAPKAAAAGSGDPLISEDHPSAKPLKYKHDATTIEASLRADKPEKKGAEQFCSNCNFFKPVEGKPYGKCTLIPAPGKHVSEKGWCVTWSLKA